MNLKNKIKIILLLIIFLSMFLTIKTYAASISISSSKSSVAPGEQFTVQVTGSDATGKVNVSVSNGSGSTSVWVENNTQTITVTAGSSGKVEIKATPAEADGTLANSSGVDEKVSGASTSVPIASNNGGGTSSSNNGETSSSNSGSSSNSSQEQAPILTNLGIRPNDFSGFKSSKTSYSVSVPNDCTSVNIYANGTGTITGTGTVNLKEGTNKFNITVSNNKGSKTYTLSIIRKTEETEDVPNLIDDENSEETNENENEIGLTGLRIAGYDFNEEFDKNKFDYTVTVHSDLTLEELEEIKTHLTAIANVETVTVKSEASIQDDGTPIITVVVKDDEKEYAKYTISFINDSKEVKTSAVTGETRISNSGNDDSLQKISKEVIIVLILSLINSTIALFYAFSAYKNKRKIDRYKAKFGELEENNFNDFKEEKENKNLYEYNNVVPKADDLYNFKDEENNQKEQEDKEIENKKVKPQKKARKSGGGKH